MATPTTSPRAQGVALGTVRKDYPTLSNAAQVAVWKYGADVCVDAAVGGASDLRGMQRDAAKKAGAELLDNPAPALISSTSVARKAITARRDNRKFTARSGVYKCECCGKQTRETGEDESELRLCRRCLLESYAVNASSDHGKDSDYAKQAWARLAEYDAAHDLIGTAPTRAPAAPAPAAKRNSSTFTKEQLAVMREIAASARKHASK